VIGATGVLGRPVTRRLAQDGVPVRVKARRPDRAAALFPAPVETVPGDLRVTADIDRAIQGCGAVYVSVDSRPGEAFRPETHGLQNVITAAKNHQRPRLLVLSAFGASRPDAAAHPGWHAQEKWRAQDLARRSRLPWTVFEPTWFMESLPLFAKGGSLAVFRGVRLEPYWVAGDDYGRWVSAALREGKGMEEIVPVQGPEKISFAGAAARFAAAYGGLRVRSLPAWVLRLAALVSADARELRWVFDLSSEPEPVPDPLTWRKFGLPAMTVEAYAAYAKQTHDFPQK
jgi:uncharacterized protein YbjT (DUF2867 family)